MVSVRIWAGTALGTAAALFGCGGDDGEDGGADGPDAPYVVPGHNDTGAPPTSSAAANQYSWDGSWNPAPSECPLAGLLDETHGEAGADHPALPPGKWGWDNACDCPGDEGLAIYENEYVEKGLDFGQLLDGDGRHFGWRLLDTDGGGIDLDHRGDAFAGSDGVDLFDLDPDGSLSSTGPSDETTGINLAEGPDMLRYTRGQSVDM